MKEIILKRVSKYNIGLKHELFSFCDIETYHAKNLNNLANYLTNYYKPNEHIN